MINSMGEPCIFWEGGTQLRRGRRVARTSVFVAVIGPPVFPPVLDDARSYAPHFLGELLVGWTRVRRRRTSVVSAMGRAETHRSQRRIPVRPLCWVSTKPLPPRPDSLGELARTSPTSSGSHASISIETIVANERCPCRRTDARLAGRTIATARRRWTQMKTQLYGSR